MPASSSTATPVVRQARPEDNAALVALAAACPMNGDIGLCVDRAPDFFTLSRLEGDPWRVGVIDGPDGTPIACVGFGVRHLYLDGVPTRVAYFGDLKVHPDHRRGGVGMALARWAHTVAAELVGADGIKIFTVLAGNVALEKGLELFAVDDAPVTPVGTIRSLSVPLLARRRTGRGDVVVDHAVRADIPEMARLWQRLAPHRAFAPVLDEQSLRRWIEEAPGLRISDYLLARRRGDDAIVGFMGLWDQHSIKQMRVTEYSPSLGRLRPAFNAVAAMAGVTRLPRPGRELRYRNVVHACVAPGDTATLRALALHANNWLREQRYSIFTIGLDVGDPLIEAFTGLFAQPTDVTVVADRIMLGDNKYAPVRRDSGPLHFEISTV